MKGTQAEPLACCEITSWWRESSILACYYCAVMLSGGVPSWPASTPYMLQASGHHGVQGRVRPRAVHEMMHGDSASPMSEAGLMSMLAGMDVPAC